MDDEVGVADGGFDDADIAWEGGDVLAAPVEADGVFDFAFEACDLEQRVVEEVFGFAVDESVEVPEAVGFDEAGVVDGIEEVGVIDEEEIGDVIEVDELVEGFVGEAVFLEELVDDGGGGGFGVMVELG
ncbi:MAG: hypothetical protein RI897_1877 [Verrucomicrobiota bacterium]